MVTWLFSLATFLSHSGVLRISGDACEDLMGLFCPAYVVVGHAWIH